MKTNPLLTTACTAMLGLGITGCATNAGNGALIGGAAGAGVGLAVTRGHPIGALVGGTIGALTGASVGAEADRAEAYNRYYYDGHYYAYPPPPPARGVYETRTTYTNPDGSTTTYVRRSYGYY